MNLRYTIPDKGFLIQTEEKEKPYNTLLVLPLEILEEILPCVTEEMMCGLVESDMHDRVILQMNLSKEKIAWLNAWHFAYKRRQSAEYDGGSVSLVA